jgi:hypothetical protein
MSAWGDLPGDTAAQKLATGAELAARRTAAAAVLADFHAAAVAFQRGGERPDHAMWALRLEQHLRYVLDGLDVEAAVMLTRDEAVMLTRDEAAMVADALADAETYRMAEASALCADCEKHPSGACEACLDDVAAAQAYHDLAEQLGTEADR